MFPTSAYEEPPSIERACYPARARGANYRAPSLEPTNEREYLAPWRGGGMIPVMATRIGIELSPDACRIVEIDPAPAWERRRGQTRVRSFAVLPPSGPDTEAKLRSLRKRRAAVVVWSAASEHRQVMVSPGSYESMRADAIGALDAAGEETRGIWVDIAPATRTADRATPRPVVVALASGSELTAALQPLLEAGIRVRTVMTPAAALSSLARLRRESWTPDALEVFVALEERATCIALLRGGALMASRDLGWGYVDEFGSGLETRRREDIATRLVEVISDFVAATGGAPGDIKQVCVCGGHPELRSVTAPLMEQLDVEFEPLDSLFGIDGESLPEPVDEFRERAAELRLAWAAAADSPPTINLLRARNRQASKSMLARAAVVTGVAAALVVGWRVQSQWRRSTAPAATARSAANVSPGARRATPGPPVTASKAPPAASPPTITNRTSPFVPPVAASKTPPVVPPQPSTTNRTLPVVPPPSIANRTSPAMPPAVAASKAPPVVSSPAIVTRTSPVVPPPLGASKAPPVVTASPSIANRTPPVVPPSPPVAASKTPVMAPPTAIAPPAVAAREEPRQPSAVVTPPARGTPARVGQEPARARGPTPPEVALPFDAVLGTILYSPDRKLAIIDGRIVGPGDEIRGARILEITPGAVILRDGVGRLRQLTMTSGAR
jgi:hypothetical protein